MRYVDLAQALGSEFTDFQDALLGELGSGTAFPCGDDLAPLADHVLHVVNMRADEKVGRVDACTVVASVADAHAWRNRLRVVRLPGDPMRKQGSFGVAVFHDLAVAALEANALPFPARVFVQGLGQKLLKAFKKGSRFARHGYTFMRD